jgi:uncharacterized Rmd1/YagE family protein
LLLISQTIILGLGRMTDHINYQDRIKQALQIVSTINHNIANDPNEKARDRTEASLVFLKCETWICQGEEYYGKEVNKFLQKAHNMILTSLSSHTPNESVTPLGYSSPLYLVFLQICQ